MTIYPNLILDTLRNVRYPGNGKNLVENNMVADDIRIDGNKVTFSLIFDKPTDPFIRSVVRSAEAALQQAIGPELEIKGNIAVQSRTPLPDPGCPRCPPWRFRCRSSTPAHWPLSGLPRSGCSRCR